MQWLSYRSPIRRDILSVARGSLDTDHELIAFGALFDAAIRATWTVALDDFRRQVPLCGAV